MINKNSIQLQTYTRTFLEKSWEWLRDPYIKQMTNTPEFTNESSLKWFQALATKHYYRIWGLAYCDIPIGACGLKCDSAHNKAEYWGYIGEKSMHGKGIGKEMMRLIEAKSKELKISVLWLKVLVDNEPAIRLYNKLNYIEYNRDHQFIYMKKTL